MKSQWQIAWMTLVVGPMIYTQAHAYTLRNYSDLQGWSNDTLKFYVNTDDCPDSREALIEALEMAIDLWNGVPTSGIQLKYAGETTMTAAAASTALNNGTAGDPVIVCDSNISTTIGGDANYIAGAANTVDDSTPRPIFGAVFMNAEAGNYANIETFDSTEIAITLAHEMGHVLGLGHTDDNGSLMYFDSTERTKLSLSQDDMDGISYLYPRNEFGGDGFLGCASIQDRDSGSGGNSGSGGGRSNNGILELALLLGICAASSLLPSRLSPRRA